MTVRSASTRRLVGLRPLLATAAMVSLALAVFTAASSTDLTELVATSPDLDGRPGPTSTAATGPSDGPTTERMPSSTAERRAERAPTDPTPPPTGSARPGSGAGPEPTTTAAPAARESVERAGDDRAARSTSDAPPPADTEPAATTPPADTEPAVTEPADTEPARTDPADTEPANGGSADTEPARTDPADTEPANGGSAGQGPPASGSESQRSTGGDTMIAGAASDDDGLSFQTMVAWLIALLGVLGVLSLLVPAIRSLAERWDRRDRSASWWSVLLRLLVGRSRPDVAPDDELATGPGTLDPIVVLDRLRQELEREPHPRQAVRRAYAAAESGFGNPDLARRSSETPGRYLVRTLGSIGDARPGTGGGSEAALRGLTELFLLARYSDHAVTEDMRHEAIDAVIELRSHYRRSEAVPV